MCMKIILFLYLISWKRMKYCMTIARLSSKTVSFYLLNHWGRVTHICVGNLTIIGPDNGLSPGRRQAIICTNAGILLIVPWGTNFSEILLGIQTFSFKKMHWKMSSAKWRPFCLGLNVLTHYGLVDSKILVNTGSGNGLLPDGTKLLP